MNVRDALTSEAAVQRVLGGAVLCCAFVAAGSVAWRLHEGVLLQRQVAVQEARIQRLEGLVEQLAQTSQRAERTAGVVNAYVFGRAVAGLEHDASGPQAWQLQRDRELRQRLTRLERWRLTFYQPTPPMPPGD